MGRDRRVGKLGGEDRKVVVWEAGHPPETSPQNKTSGTHNFLLDENNKMQLV